MSSKRTKRYLWVLMVVGVASVVAAGVGTFASFSAETSNNGNYFATGSLILNDNGGTTTCTSATGTGSVNPGNSSGTDCDTLFKLKKFTYPRASVASLAAAATTVNYTGLTAPIYKGDSVTITDNSNTETLTAATNSTTTSGAGSFTVTAGPTNTYSSATVSDGNPTYFANLTLQNAGSIDASGIKFKAGGTPCTSKYTEGNTTLNMGTVTLGASSGTTLTFASITAGAFQPGDSVVVSEAGHAQTFVAQSASTATTVAVTAAQNWNYAYDTSAVVSGPEFNGATAHALCSNLAMSIIETDSGFNQLGTNSVGCAYGSTGSPTPNMQCDLGSGTALDSLPSTLTALTLGSGAGTGNTLQQLDTQGIRYFLIAVHFTGPSFDNTYQNTTAANLDLTWHIDQA